MPAALAVAALLLSLERACYVTVYEGGDEGVHGGCECRGLLDRRLRVGDPDLDGAEGGVRAQLPPPDAGVGQRAGPLAPGEGGGVFLPAGERRRHALPRQQLADLGPDGGQAAVLAAVEGRVGGEGEQLGKALAKAVVDRERGVRGPDRHVHLEGERELPPGDPAVLLVHALVPFAGIELALLSSERVHSRAGEPDQALAGAREVGSGGVQELGGVPCGPQGRARDLELCGRHLHLEAAVFFDTLV